jgi:4-hydroxy-2-oxoheptanedioate aldolase
MRMNMRNSRVLRQLRSGHVVTSVKINFNDPRVVEIAAACGFDCCWLDMEHVPTDWKMIEESIRAAKIHDSDIVVRVEKGSYSDYIRPLETDAAGIIVPHVTSKLEAEKIVRMTKFHPVGMRPVDGGNADGQYCMIDFNDYLEQANRQRFVCIQIEDVEALEQLEEIIGVEGLDMVFFGPGDFSQSMGKPGQFTDPFLVDTRKRIAELCHKHGKFAATVGSPEDVAGLASLGYSFINIGADVVGLSSYYQGLLQRSKVTEK